MIVTVMAMRRSNNSWLVEKQVECSEDKVSLYVKMFFTMGYEKVRVE